VKPLSRPLPAEAPPDVDRPGCDDEPSLQLPMLGLFADLELGAGSVALPDEFEASDPSRRLAILRDWSRDLQRARARAAQALHDTIVTADPGPARDAQRARWQARCAELGVEPTDGAAGAGQGPPPESPHGPGSAVG